MARRVARKMPGAGEAVYRGTAGAEIVDDDKRTVRFVASSEEVDRYGDIVRASGWQLDTFRSNPILLYGHNSRSLPIGRVNRIEVDGTRLMADAEFMSADLSPEGDTVYRMVKARFLNAVSVGFNPTVQPKKITDPTTNEWTGGFEFVGQELFELSVVPIPALPGALAVSRAFRSDEDFYRELAPTFDDCASARIEQARSRLRTLALRQT